MGPSSLSVLRLNFPLPLPYDHIIPDGNHNGVYEGTRFFKTPPKKGLFVPLRCVQFYHRKGETAYKPADETAGPEDDAPWF